VKTPEQMLEEFQATFQTPNTPEFWAKLVAEEEAEVIEAVVHLVKEMADLAYVLAGYANAGGKDTDLPKIAMNEELLIDILEAFARHNIPHRSLARVHANNMSKVHADGTIKRREDGKVLKPEGYQPCDLSDLVR